MKPKFKIALIFGTRPEIIKLSPLMRHFAKEKVPYFMIHTGQHYSPEMDRIFFSELKLPAPQYELHVRSKAAWRQGDHTGRMLVGIEEALLKGSPTHVLVQGDTNSVLAGALVSSKVSTTRSYTGMRYVLAHVEAGLRSFDREMPEEINRFISDHVSDILFAPTRNSREQLVREGVEPGKIFVTGNTIVDAVFQNLEIARKTVDEQALLDGVGREFILVTLHRQENVDHPARLQEILSGIDEAARTLGRTALFTMHPRTRAKVRRFKVSVPRSIRVMPPVGFLEFLILESRASLVMSDSGGIQEESCILGVPCVTLRTTTERPETVQVGANTIAGIERRGIVRSAKRMARARSQWKNPYGDGHAAERMLAILRRHPLSMYV